MNIRTRIKASLAAALAGGVGAGLIGYGISGIQAAFVFAGLGTIGGFAAGWLLLTQVRSEYKPKEHKEAATLTLTVRRKDGQYPWVDYLEFPEGVTIVHIQAVAREAIKQKAFTSTIDSVPRSKLNAIRSTLIHHGLMYWKDPDNHLLGVGVRLVGWRFFEAMATSPIGEDLSRFPE